MSELEDPTTTVIRLLSKKMNAVREDGETAQIHVSPAWFDRELLKDYDGQVTVALAGSQDRKVEMSGRLRRRLGTLKINVWAADKPQSSDSGMLMRSKMVEEVNRVVRENRNTPNIAEYDFVGLGYPEGEPHKCFHVGALTELPTTDSGWAELSSDEYAEIWYSDDERFLKAHNVEGEYAQTLFRFKIDSREETIKQIVLAFEGYGIAPAGCGVTIKVWNHVEVSWQQMQTGTGETDETLMIALASNLLDYVDEDGYVWLLARTSNPSDGATSATLYCDYTVCTVTVNGITYLDIADFREDTIIDVKPFIFHAEFTLKSWSFENLGT